MSSQKTEALTLDSPKSGSEGKGEEQSFGLLLDLEKHLQTGSQVELALQTMTELPITISGVKSKEALCLSRTCTPLYKDSCL